jgi:cation diffusion facilitator CzcD-associated flavoprotein CzcO
MIRICIVGAGVTGLILLLLLQDAGFDMSTVCIIDPHFDGGDLARNWTTVISNTPWSKTINSLATHLPSLSIPTSFDPSSLTPLIEIANLLRTLCEPILKKVKLVQGTVLESNYDSANNLWNISVNSEGMETIQSIKLILSQGSAQKTMNLSIPSIPLDIALDATRVKNYVKSGDKVIVFGTAHSGTLVIQNLVNLGATVTACYNRDRPFRWDRDGAYDGIKADASEIADKIMAGTISVALVQRQDTVKMIRASRDAKWVVYAIGFTPRLIQIFVDGVKVSNDYDGLTGRLTQAPAWGFGIAYPNRAPDGVHWDVSVAAFLEHIKLQIPSIIEQS